jgi:hypothetical protein
VAQAAQPEPWLTSLRCRRVTSTTTVSSPSSLTADLLRFMPARSLSDLLPRLALDRGRATCRTHMCKGISGREHA